MTALASGSQRVRLASKRQHMTVTAQIRLVAVLALFGIGVGAILLRLTFIGVFGEQAQAATRSGLVDPGRGDIVDRNGVPLARTIDGYAIRVVPERLIGDRKVLAASSRQIFPDTSEARFLKLLSRNKPTYLRHRAVPEEVNRVHALGEVGIEFPREKERFYPQLQLAAHVLGYVHPDGHGVSGMERAMDKELLDPKLRLTPSALSVDIRVQAALEDELGRAMKSYDAKAAAGVVLDVRDRRGHGNDIAAQLQPQPVRCQQRSVRGQSGHLSLLRAGIDLQAADRRRRDRCGHGHRSVAALRCQRARCASEASRSAIPTRRAAG